MKNLELKTITSNLSRKVVDSVRGTYNWSKNHINYKMGAFGASFAGGIAFYENYSHGFNPAAFAFGKQAALVVFAGGLNTKTCEKMAKKFKSKPISIAAATIVSTIQAGAIIYLVHEINGTPEATNTALAISSLNLPAFFGLGWYYRNKHDKGESKGLFIQQ